MNLQQYAQSLVDRHTTGGLYLNLDEVVACAVAATQEYAGWAGELGTEATPWDGSAESITPQTAVSSDEWAIISRLFDLLVEAGNALRLESLAGMGMPQPPRSSSEVASSLQAFRDQLPNLAFQCNPTSSGFPEGY